MCNRYPPAYLKKDDDVLNVFEQPEDYHNESAKNEEMNEQSSKRSLQALIGEVEYPGLDIKQLLAITRDRAEGNLFFYCEVIVVR